MEFINVLTMRLNKSGERQSPCRTPRWTAMGSVKMEETRMQARKEEANHDAFQKMMDDNEINQDDQATLRGITVKRLDNDPGPAMVYDIGEELKGIPAHAPYSCRRFAAALGFSRPVVDHIDRCQHGGGNPAHECLKAVQDKHGDEELNKLLRSLDSYFEPKRAIHDILDRVKGKVMFIRDLTPDDLYAISDHINRPAWEKVARDFKFKGKEISQLAKTIEVPNNFSCTKEIFRLLEHQSPPQFLSDVFNLLPKNCQDGMVPYMKKILAYPEDAAPAIT